MVRRVGTVAILALMTLPSIVFSDPPPPCSCDFCIPDPEASCKLPQGGVTTCGIFMRPGICLGLTPEEVSSAEEPSEICLEAESKEESDGRSESEVESPPIPEHR